ncbi:MAG: hypothetical protein R2710_11745 [Acidimicrobiales bacterium]
MTEESGLGVLVITHYARLLQELRPDVVHVLAKGQILASGGPELADELEETGYAGYAEEPVAAGGPGAGRRSLRRPVRLRCEQPQWVTSPAAAR